MFKSTDECFDSLKRCAKCLLTDTFPGIKFDKHGICNYCNDQEPVNVFGEEAFIRKLNDYRRKAKTYDCIVPISGGRDSAYVLHQIVRKYGLKPLALTVDSGFMTEDAKQNIEQITKVLDVDHVYLRDEKQIASARKNSIHKFKGWLKNPNINTIVPVLNSGDKLMNFRMFRYAHDHKIPVVMGGNTIGTSSFEHEHFKTGFLGVFQNDKGIYSTWQKIKLMLYFFSDFLMNTYNWNYSIFKEYFEGVVIYFFDSKFRPSDVDSFGFYDYIKWNEAMIVDTIKKDLGWEGSSETTTTWRIDDSAYPLINYIYFQLSGFTEHTELYSKMIRDGQITREEAIKRCKTDSKPREKALAMGLEELNVTPEELNESLQKYRVKVIEKYLRGTSIEKCTF